MASSPAPSPGDLHEDQIVTLLRSGAHAALLIAYFGENEYRELAQLARLAATRRTPRGVPVYILPGIMGSRLGSVHRRVADLLWLHPTAIGEGRLLELAHGATRTMRPLGVMLPGYLKLRLMLEIAGFRPRFHPFDWRADLDRLGRAFARALEQADTAKVFVVAHSMGGLVARMAQRYDTKRRMAKLVQLGAPNAGSFAPVQALRAVYPTVRKMAALDRHHSAEELARRVFLGLPGLYQMLPSPLSSTEADLFDVKAWPQDDLIPDATMLKHARGVRAKLPCADASSFAIVGVEQETIVAVRREADEGFRYTIRRAGDGTVPLERALWDGAATWFAPENHGMLTNNTTVLGAVVDLLREGTTEKLSATRPPPSPAIVREATDRELRAAATHKVAWESLSLDSRRRILDPILTPEFLAPKR
jgi:pimeloyl-ACP methyl ester carboxylesterase